MTTYQDLFNTMNNSTMDPSTLLSQQDALASLFPGLNSTVIDDWLADELCKSGLITQDFSSSLEKQQDILAMLPHSPPITPNSPTNSSMSDRSPKTPCAISLFPDITPTPAPVVTIMPKSGTILPRIAPRPATTTPMMMVMMKEPPMLNNKRRIMESNVVVDQDEIALKRQKNTDAARRSRLKKLVKMEQLEQKISDLESDNHRLTTRIAVLESEKSGLESKDHSLEDRIRVLEAQLAEAHKALTTNKA